MFTSWLKASVILIVFSLFFFKSFTVTLLFCRLKRVYLASIDQFFLVLDGLKQLFHSFQVSQQTVERSLPVGFLLPPASTNLHLLQGRIEGGLHGLGHLLDLEGLLHAN